MLITIIELLVVLLALYLGSRYGSLALGAIAGLGLAILVFDHGLKPGTPPTNVIYIIVAAVTCAGILQASGGMDWLIQIAEKLLRRHPRQITFFAPICTFFLTVLVGTGHVMYTLMPIIADVSLKKGIRPERPCAIASVASMIAIVCSPISAAVVAFSTISALNGFHITTSCENVELACKWGDWWYSEEGSLLANYGIEHESFEFNEHNVPVFTDLVLNNPEGMSTTVALFMYCMDRGPFYRDETREQSGYTEDQKAASEIWMSNLSVGRGMGSTMINAEESDKVNQSYGDIKTYIEQSVLQFITGQRDLSEFDAYVENIKSMGIDEVTECYQAAYERYLNGEVVEMGGPMGPPPPGAPPPP